MWGAVWHWWEQLAVYYVLFSMAGCVSRGRPSRGNNAGRLINKFTIQAPTLEGVKCVCVCVCGERERERERERESESELRFYCHTSYNKKILFYYRSRANRRGIWKWKHSLHPMYVASMLHISIYIYVLNFQWDWFFMVVLIIRVIIIIAFSKPAVWLIMWVLNRSQTHHAHPYSNQWCLILTQITATNERCHLKFSLKMKCLLTHPGSFNHLL